MLELQRNKQTGFHSAQRPSSAFPGRGELLTLEVVKSLRGMETYFSRHNLNDVLTVAILKLFLLILSVLFNENKVKLESFYFYYWILTVN